MPNIRRSLSLAALLPLILAVPSGLSAQDNGIVGPPELSNFQLGPRPAPTPVPAETPPPGTTFPLPDPSGQQSPVTLNPPPPAARAAPPEPRTQSQPAPAPAPREEPPLPAATETEIPQAVEAQPGFGLPTTTEFEREPEAPPALPAAARDAPLPAWTWLGAAGLLALLGFLVLRRRRNTARPVPAGIALDRAAPPAPSPAPAPLPPAAVRETPSPRPRLELELISQRASITDDQALIHFDLTIRNVGQSPTRYVRFDARLFNAGVDQDRATAAFFSAPIEEKTVSAAPRAIPPQGEIRLRSVATMARQDMRAIELEDRRLFVPVLALNVLYEWDESGSGQTAISYTIGRETEPPTEKMGPFRLDLGPRLYRSVGQRRNRLERRL